MNESDLARLTDSLVIGKPPGSEQLSAISYIIE